MQRALLALLFIALFQPSQNSLAHHPNEGTLTLESLTQEALANSPELRSMQLKTQASKLRLDASKGLFFPSVSLEGGSLTTKFDQEKNSGALAYGKLEWNLYRGGRDLSEKNDREAESDFSSKQFSLAKGSLTREVAAIYYEISFLLENIAIQDEALILNQEQTKSAQRRRSAGITSETDVFEFELREATIKSDIRELKQRKDQKSRELCAVLGRSEIKSDLDVKGHLERQHLTIDPRKLLELIPENNLEIQELKLKQSLSNGEKKSAQAQFFPSVDFLAKAGKLANEERVFKDSNNYSFGLLISVPIFSGFSSINEVDSASSLIASNDASYTRKLLGAKAEVENLASQLITIQDRMDLEEKNLSRSEQYYKLTMAEYKRGTKNSPDVVGATERFLNSKIRNLEFRRDYQVALLRLSGIAGSDLGAKSLESSK